tara:strand:+ start:931 stop:2304 length:1374 start_codon:yes stop_codon:yes gene_type:complete
MSFAKRDILIMNQKVLLLVGVVALTYIGLFRITGSEVRSETEIDITRGTVEPSPIAVTNFHAVDPSAEILGAEISAVIAANLEGSGLFRPIDQRAFQQKPEELQQIPRFVDWRQINAEFLVSGMVEVGPDNLVNVEFRLWNVVSEQYMVGKRLKTPKANWRRVAHLISDELYTRVTGEGGYFDTRIVYVAESGPADNRVKQLALMDQDGENHRYLTDGRHMALTPRFSPTLQEITYLSYFNDKPRVYIYNIDTGKQEVLGDFPGMTFAPRFSPDGNQVIMSMARYGNSDIYVMDLHTRVVEKLTDHPAIETAPSFSPDAQRVTFESDRSGKQQIYVMEAVPGAESKRISYGSGKYATPVWSPRGDWIAFTNIYRGVFYIGVMRPDGTGERKLAKGFLVEGPTWAPNGRLLMFYRQEPPTGEGSGDVGLYSVDILGTNLRKVMTPMNASDPAWSPLIP